MRIGVIGATGSVGLQTLEVVDRFPHNFKVTVLVGGKQTESLRSLAAKYRAMAFSPFDGNMEYAALTEALEQVDLLVYAASTVKYLDLLLDFLSHGKSVCLSTKELVVEAWPFLREFRSQIRPVDSEHSALWRLGAQESSVSRIYIVGSGGSLRDKSNEEVENATLSEVLAHPVWHMGDKVTFDSAFLINKSMEVIEAAHLFDKRADQISIVIERTGRVHGVLDLVDGSRLILMSRPTMVVPISHALFYPELPPMEELQENLVTQSLQFQEPDYERFPWAKLGHLALASDYTSRMAFSVADEVAFDMFKAGLLRPMQIYSLLEGAIEKHRGGLYPSSTDEFFALREQMLATFRMEALRL